MKYIVIKKGANKVVYFGPYMTLREAELYIRKNQHPDYEYDISEIFHSIELTHCDNSTIISNKEVPEL